MKKPHEVIPVLAQQVSVSFNDDGATLVFGNLDMSDETGKTVNWHTSVFFARQSYVMLRDLLTQTEANFQQRARKQSN